MWKIIDKKEKSLIKFLLTSIVFIIWIIVLLFVIPTVLTLDETFMQYYIPFAVVVCWLIICFLLLWLDYNLKPRFKDWKYVWKDWRVYEGDWDKKYWANWKWKLTWADWSYYEWDFKKGHLSWKWKKVSSNGESYEWDWENSKWNWKWKLVWPDWSYYEWEFKDWKMDWKWKLIWLNWSYYEWDFKDGKMDWEWIIEMNSGFSYIWEFSEWRAKWKMRKQKHSDWSVIEWSFVCDGFANFTGEWKATYPKWFVYIWSYKGWVPVWKWKRILNNWEYSEWNRVNWVLTWLARYYFKDWSYYEWECGDMWWQWIWTYVTKKWEEYQTEFPYGIIDVFRYWLDSKIEEIDWTLSFTPKSEKEKLEEKNKYLEISEKWTPIQKEIAKFSLKEEEDNENFLNSLKSDGFVWDVFKIHMNILKFYEESKKNIKKIADKNHIEYSGKVSSYSYWRYFYELDSCYDVAIEISGLFIKIYKFLDPENILKSITKREEMDKEWVILFDEFSSKYKEYIQICLDWREYEKKFWEHNFKPDKRSK